LPPHLADGTGSAQPVARFERTLPRPSSANKVGGHPREPCGGGSAGPQAGVRTAGAPSTIPTITGPGLLGRPATIRVARLASTNASGELPSVGSPASSQVTTSSSKAAG